MAQMSCGQVMAHIKLYSNQFELPVGGAELLDMLFWQSAQSALHRAHGSLRPCSTHLRQYGVTQLQWSQRLCTLICACTRAFLLFHDRMSTLSVYSDTDNAACSNRMSVKWGSGCQSFVHHS